MNHPISQHLISAWHRGSDCFNEFNGRVQRDRVEQRGEAQDRRQLFFVIKLNFAVLVDCKNMFIY